MLNTRRISPRLDRPNPLPCTCDQPKSRSARRTTSPAQRSSRCGFSRRRRSSSKTLPPPSPTRCSRSSSRTGTGAPRNEKPLHGTAPRRTAPHRTAISRCSVRCSSGISIPLEPFVPSTAQQQLFVVYIYCTCYVRIQQSCIAQPPASSLRRFRSPERARACASMSDVVGPDASAVLGRKRKSGARRTRVRTSPLSLFLSSCFSLFLPFSLSFLSFLFLSLGLSVFILPPSLSLSLSLPLSPSLSVLLFFFRCCGILSHASTSPRPPPHTTCFVLIFPCLHRASRHHRFVPPRILGLL